jgi:hypothetical protein
MAFQKRKSPLLLMVCSLLTVFCPDSHSSGTLPDPFTQDTAAREGIRRFGNQSRAHFLKTFGDPEGAPAVYVFLVTKDSESIPEDIEASIEAGRKLLKEAQSLIQAGQIEEGEKLITRSKGLLFQENHYGTLLLSAKQEEPTLVAFHHGLPTCLVAKTEARERAKAFSNGNRVIPLGVLYHSPLEYYLEFEGEGQKILVSPLDSEIFFSVECVKDLESSPLPMPGEKFEDSPPPAQGNLYDQGEKDDPEIEGLGRFPDSLTISDVPDYNQRPWLPKSCAPTAGACLFGYWDIQGYEDFLQGEGSYDDATHLIEHLCQTMNWEPSSGVYYSQVPTGLRQVVDECGYAFTTSNLFGIHCLDIVRQEINATRPFIYGSQQNPWRCGHYVVVVGYQENFIIVHDNWWSTPTDYFVNWDALGHSDDMMTTLVPRDQSALPSEPLPHDVGGSGGGCFVSAASQR